MVRIGKVVRQLTLIAIFVAICSPSEAEEITSPKSLKLPENKAEGMPSVDEITWAERYITEKSIASFRELSAQKATDYSSLKGRKAAAVCVDSTNTARSPFWGAAWEFDTLEEAQQRALASCEKARADARNSDCKCELLFRDEEVVRPPDGLVREAIANAKAVAKANNLSIPTLCGEWIRDANGAIVSPNVEARRVANSDSTSSCPGYTRNSIARVNFVINDVLHATANAESPEIYPGPPVVRKDLIEKLRITNPSTGKLEKSIGFYLPTGDSYIRTWSTPYELPSGWHYSFNLHRVPSDQEATVLTKLANIERTKMYRRFGHTKRANVDLPFFNESDQLAQYARTYDLSNDADRESFHLEPDYWRGGILLGERARRLWVECTIPIDDSWVPVGAPLRVVTPIAIQTTAGLYLYAVEVLPTRSGGGMLDRFEGRVFDLSACRGSAQCFNEVRRVLVTELTTAFQQNPLLASPVRSSVPPPNQIRFRREYEESQVLKGLAGPYYELSTYTITLWSGPAKTFMGSAESYYARRTSGDQYDPVADQVYLQVSQALQISVGRKGSYEEPKQDQYAAYQRVVDDAIKGAVSRATTRLGGAIADGVGIIPTLRLPE